MTLSHFLQGQAEPTTPSAPLGHSQILQSTLRITSAQICVKTYFMLSEQKHQDKKLILGQLRMKAATTATRLCTKDSGKRK